MTIRKRKSKFVKHNHYQNHKKKLLNLILFFASEAKRHIGINLSVVRLRVCSMSRFVLAGTTSVSRY